MSRRGNQVKEVWVYACRVVRAGAEMFGSQWDTLPSARLARLVETLREANGSR